MKKVLSFVLVLAMILGSFSMVFAASFSDVETGADHEEAINVLSSLGVVSGYTDGTFKPEKVVTRAEMAAFIINALFGEDKQITQRATKFSDVTAAHWASGFVDYANTLGIISGYTDGTFKPDQVVNYNEAITMIVKALGYNDDCLVGTWPANYVNGAKALGLLEDVDGLGTAGAVRGDIAQLVYNALTSPIGTVNKDGEWVANTTKAGKGKDTMLARLGGYQDDEAVVIEKSDVDAALVDISEYLGAYAKVVRTKENGPIVGIYSLESEAYTGKVKSETQIGDYKFKSTVDTDEIVFFLNGVVTSGAALTDSEFAGKEVTVWGEFSGKYATEVYSVLRWDPEEAFLFDDSLNTKKCKLGTYDFAKNDDDEIDTDSFILVGVDALEDIEDNNVVTVYLADSKIVKIEVGTETVTGKISRITGKDTPDEKIYVAGESYKLDDVELIDDLTTTSAKKFGTEFVLYKDYAGNVCFVGLVDEGDATEYYAVVLDAYCGTEGKSWVTDETATTKQVKLFDADGKTNVYTLASKLAKAGGLTKSANGFTIDDEDDDSALGLVVVYTLNDDGEIKTIEKVATTEAKEKAVSKKGLVDGKYYFEDDALVFEVEVTKESEKITKVTAELVKASDLYGKTLTTPAYTVADSGKVDLLVVGSVGSVDNVYGIYVKDEQTDDEEFTAYFYVDGELVSYSAEKVTGDKVVTALATVKATDELITITALEPTTGASISSKVTVKANTVVVDENEEGSFALDKDVVVYLYDTDEKELSVSTVDALKKAKEIVFYDIDALEGDADGTYEVVIFATEIPEV